MQDEPTDQTEPGATLRDRVVELIMSKGYERREEPFRLSSGGWSNDYVDCRRALQHGDDLSLVARAVIETAANAGLEFDAVGGLTMGADPTAHAVAVLAHCKWFTVRKATKSHGRQRRLEGAELDASTRVLVVDDVATTGGSLIETLDVLQEAAGRVVGAVTILDRGERTAQLLAQRGLPYRPVITYRDLGIDPIGSPPE